MSRRTSSSASQVDNSFPIRIKIVVPPTGMGTQLEIIGLWLNKEIGKGRFGSCPAPHKFGSAIGYHFLSFEDAARFVAAFPDLELAVAMTDPQAPVSSQAEPYSR